jgi:uncharacterized protein YndB with AHSA1/START domain
MTPTQKPAVPAPGTKALTLTLPSDREIVMTRVFDAPRRLVFEAHSKPEHVRRWWGPRRFTVSVRETREDRDGMLQSGMEAGAAETTDRLAEYLGGMS